MWKCTVNLLAALVVGLGASAGDAAPPAERIVALTRGVNLSHWYWLPSEKDPARQPAFISDEELKALASAGFTCARFPVEPGVLWDPQNHALRSDNLAAYRAAVDRIVSAGLAVVVDPHPIDLKWERPDPSTGRAGEYEAFWSALAGALAETDPTRVILEVMNEPHDIKEKDLWPRAQEHIVRAIRAKAPRHTVIVTGDDYGGIDGLLRLKPLDDSNLIYSFHFYDPHIFTHQGASWGWDGWKEVRGLSYPADAANAGAERERITHKDGRWSLQEYAKEYASSAKIRERIKAAAQWAQTHKAAVWCGEFGVYAAHSPRESRLAWHRDVTEALATHRIGWAMWDYCGGFGVASGARGERRMDADLLKALGQPR